MVKKTITYEDYNGIERTEDFMFNLSKAEMIEMELSKHGGLGEYYQSIINAKDTPTLMAIFRELIVKSYGERSEDGRRFKKKEADGTPLGEGFTETEAYSKLLESLFEDQKGALEFFKGIVPKDIQQAANDPVPMPPAR